jgi:hypothetical protein
MTAAGQPGVPVPLADFLQHHLELLHVVVKAHEDMALLTG